MSKKDISKIFSPAPAPSAAPVDLFQHHPGHESATVAGKSYGTQTSIQDTDKRAGKPRSILNVPAARVS